MLRAIVQAFPEERNRLLSPSCSIENFERSRDGGPVKAHFTLRLPGLLSAPVVLVQEKSGLRIRGRGTRVDGQWHSGVSIARDLEERMLPEVLAELKQAGSVIEFPACERGVNGG